MALTWDLTAIEKKDELCWVGDGDSKRLNPITETLIWYTMFVGQGVISDANVVEFATRVTMWERVFGPTLQSGKKKVPITPEHVRQHIGLRTNASSMTAKQFGAHVAKVVRSDAANVVRDSEAKRAKEKAA